MKKFIGLNVVSYIEIKGTTLVDEHHILMDISFIKGAVDYSLSLPDRDVDGSRIILTIDGQAFFNRYLFSLSERNGLIDNDSVLVKEGIHELQKLLREAGV